MHSGIGSNTFVIVIVHLFVLPWRWPHKWPKHVGEYPITKLHQNTIVRLLLLVLYSVDSCTNFGKAKAVPLQAWSGPEGCSKLRFPDFMTSAQDGGKVVSLTHRPPLLPANAPGTHFC